MRSVALFIGACLAAAVIPLWTPSLNTHAAGFPGWPASFEGRALSEEPLDPVEQVAARGFPGRMGRFTDGQRQIVLRWVNRPSRQLHPAEVCFRGMGYQVTFGPLTRDGAGALWSSFEARRGEEHLAVRSRIHDENGQAWQDVSGWFWAAALGRTAGPWWAFTVAERK